jgi:hypothetical protein
MSKQTVLLRNCPRFSKGTPEGDGDDELKNAYHALNE